MSIKTLPKIIEFWYYKDYMDKQMDLYINNKIKHLILLVILLIIVLLLTGCGVEENKIVIFVKGSRSMSHIFKNIASDYIESTDSGKINLPTVLYGILPSDADKVKIPAFDRSNIEFVFMDGGSSRGIASILDGNKNGELILSTRAIEPNEIRTIENINRTYIGDVIYGFKYAEDNIIPITNRKNPIHFILKREIKEILQGNIKSWTKLFAYRKLYPSKAVETFITDEGLRIDTRIQATIRERASGIDFVLRTRLTSGIITNDILEIANDENILKYVSKIYNSFSMISSIYRSEFDKLNIKELELREAETKIAGIIVGSNKVKNPDEFLRRDCNIYFMKNQNTTKEMETLGITVEDIIIDFINYANINKDKYWKN
ncbi:MAG: substrate-binding domain-containing protein [Spirochaetota bacterium]